MADNGGNSFVWFLAGLGLGALAGVLYAPRTGEETRQAIRQKAEEGREYAAARGREARAEADRWAAKGRDAVAKGKDQLHAAIDAGRQAYREATGEGGGSPKTS